MQQVIEGKRKGELRNELRTFSSHTVRSEINEVIKQFRNCSLKEAKDVKTLRPSEVEAVRSKFI